MFWKIKNAQLDLSRTFLMGIVNLTPDSFSDGGKFASAEDAAAHCLRLVEEGADLLDLGGESTRPGARPVSADREIQRVLPVLRKVRASVSIPISVDTTKPEVARICLEEGAQIINDVSGLAESGAEMAERVRDFGAGLILMHRRGNPETMQNFSIYENLIEEVLAELNHAIQKALDAGIQRSQLVVDPGLGFSKTAEQNIEILRHLERFHDLGLPVLLGPSRKSFIGKMTGRPASEREYGTAACAALAVLKRVHLIRVHDVASMRDAVRIAEAIRGEQYVGA